ncbi:MAG: polysaccharide biosynthesis tyrosine autokinase [bacterium]|nr:polysaccharide biosynthesis tyrosine autokinase [bacterium]
MFEDEIQLRDYLHIIIKWRWLILAVFSVTVLYATLKTFRRTLIYQATTRIIIDKRQADIALFGNDRGWGSWDEDYLKSQYEIIKSRELAGRIAEKLKRDNMIPKSLPPQETVSEIEPSSVSLDHYVTHVKKFLGVKDAPTLSESTKKTIRDEQFIEGLLGMVLVSPIEESRLVDVSVTSLNPEKAAKIANVWAESYIEQNLDNQIDASRNAVRWLVEEVEGTRAKLAESEAALQGYREQYATITFEERHNIVIQKLSEMSRAVNNARIRRLEKEAQHKQVQQYSPQKRETFPQVIQNSAIQWMKIDLSRLESQLSELERKFRGKHPEILAKQSQIARLRKEIAAEIDRTAQSVEREAEREYDVALMQEERLLEALKKQKQEAQEMNQNSITYGLLKREVESNQWVYDELLHKMKELSISGQLESNNIRIVDRAIIPSFPMNSSKRRSITLSMLIGLLFGGTLAFFLEYLDNSFKIPEEISQTLDIPFLGFVPKMSLEGIRVHEQSLQPETIVASAPKSIVSEAYRSLRTNISFAALPEETTRASQSGLALLVTSSEASEGKSCTVANLGIAIAQSGKKTLIVDCDFRKPVMHRIFQINTKEGFSDALTAAKQAKQTQNKHTRGSIKRTTVPNLDIIPCGAIPPNPSELLSSELTRMAVESLKKKYDLILLDSPPVNVVTDSVILSRIVDGTVMVIRAGKTKRELVKRGKEQLQQAGAEVLGGVLNYVDVQKNKYYYYYAYHYPHYYRKEPDPILDNAGKHSRFSLRKLAERVLKRSV